MSEDYPQVPGGFMPGHRVAGYLLEEQIGQGGMAVVFRALDERLDRRVALKILAPALAADDAFRQRFIRESRAAASVDDPHIIPVFEAGEASGVLFIAMRFVRGGDVRSLLAQGPMMPGRVAEIISQVAGALDAAHGRGLVHRDVKPANILLDASSGYGRPDHVYLSDFGLSKGTQAVSGLTGTGQFLGTLDYVAPEQIESRPVDGRADEYALACAAFELLTGAPPFRRDEAMAVMYAQISEPPPAASARRPGLSPAVDQVFAKALAKVPADRYPTCRDFSDAMREALGIRPYDSEPGVDTFGQPKTVVAWRSDPSDTAASGGAGATNVNRRPGTGSGAGAGFTASGGAVLGADAVSAAAVGAAEPAGGAPGGGAPGGGAPGGGPAGYGLAPAGDPGSSGAGAAAVSEPTTETPKQRGTKPGLTDPAYPPDEWPGTQAESGRGPARRRRLSPAALIAIVAVLLAGGGAGAYFGLRGQNTKSPPVILPVVALKPPGCSTSAATTRTLHPANSLTATHSQMPFGVVATRDGNYVFVVTTTHVVVFRTSPGGELTLQRSYPIATSPFVGTGAALTTNGYLIAAVGNGIDVLSVANAEAGSQSILVGKLTVPGISVYGRALQVAVTPDDKYAFVTMQYLNQVAVFNLQQALANNNFTAAAAYVGPLNVGNQPVGVALSPDGRWLYATSFGPAGTANVTGTLNVISVAQAEHHPQTAAVQHVQAGCNPARIAVSLDGSTVWVSTRQSNYVLAFSAPRLRSEPGKALIDRVKVGLNPIGLILASNGTRIIAADSGANNLAVVNTTGALTGKAALAGYVPSGQVPHEFALSPDGRYLYVSDNSSDQIQVIDLSKLSTP